MGYNISDIEGIGPVYKEKLKEVGITTTEALLAECCSKPGRTAIATKTGFPETTILTWTNMADLMRIKGVASQYSELLQASGVDTVKELRTRNAENLTAALEKTNAEKKLARATPALVEVTKWIEEAKTLEPVITH